MSTRSCFVRGFHDLFGGDTRPLHCFGPIWCETPSDLRQIRELIGQVNAMIEAKAVNHFAVGLFPVRIHTQGRPFTLPAMAGEPAVVITPDDGPEVFQEAAEKFMRKVNP